MTDCPPYPERDPAECYCDGAAVAAGSARAESADVRVGHVLTKKYRTIVVDPPWPFADSLRHYLYRADREGRGRGAIANYKLMGVDEIAALPVSDWAENAAHLYVWTTNTFMRDAYTLIDAWGFRDKTILTWVKPRLGMGHYFRNTTEHVIFCVRGSLRTLRRDCRTSFTAEQNGHSVKPDTFYDIVESMSPGPYLDVFARRRRLGWDAWGNEWYPTLGLPPPVDEAQGTMALP